MSIIHSWKHCRSFETFCMAWPEIWLPQFVYLRHEILSHDCVKYFPLYSPIFIQLLITHTKIKWVKYIPTFITNAESTANRISLLYFVELVVIALLFANWIVTLLLIRQESQFRFVSYKWNRISGSHEKQRREAQEGHSGWWATCFGSRWGDACESQCIDRWDLEGHEARSAGGVRREWVYLELSAIELY